MSDAPNGIITKSDIEKHGFVFNHITERGTWIFTKKNEHNEEIRFIHNPKDCAIQIVQDYADPFDNRLTKTTTLLSSFLIDGASDINFVIPKILALRND